VSSPVEFILNTLQLFHILFNTLFIKMENAEYIIFTCTNYETKYISNFIISIMRKFQQEDCVVIRLLQQFGQKIHGISFQLPEWMYLLLFQQNIKTFLPNFVLLFQVKTYEKRKLYPNSQTQEE
jgi:hypothetical protein